MSKSKSYYFGEEVDKAIVEFQNTTDKKRKDELVKDPIWPAFEKLASYWYNRLPVRKNEEVISDCVVYLYEKIPMFNAEKKKESFSYFNIIARHFFFQKLKNEKKEVMNEYDSVNIADVAEHENLIDEGYERQVENKEFVKLFVSQLDAWRKKATKENEKKVIDALILIFENADGIDIYKKKAINFYIKEITGLQPKQITSVINKLNKKFVRYKEKYLRGDI